MALQLGRNREPLKFAIPQMWFKMQEIICGKSSKTSRRKVFDVFHNCADNFGRWKTWQQLNQKFQGGAPIDWIWIKTSLVGLTKTQAYCSKRRLGFLFLKTWKENGYEQD